MEARPQPVGLANAEIQKELKNHVAGLKEMGPEWEDAMLAAFLTRVEGQIDQLVDQRVAERLQGAHSRQGPSTMRLFICLTFAVPLLAIAAFSNTGLPGVLAVMGALLLLNWKDLLP